MAGASLSQAVANGGGVGDAESWPGTLAVVGAATVMAAVLLGCAAARRVRLRKATTVAMGRVMPFVGGPLFPAPVVAYYDTTGRLRTYHPAIWVNMPYLRVGQVVQVRYDPANPGRPVQIGSVDVVFFVCVLFGASMLLSAASYLVLALLFGPGELLTSG